VNLQFSSPGGASKKTILITSPEAKAGKTTTLCNLGLTLALQKKKTLLVDADLRRSTLHRVFEVDRTPGLTDILAGECKIEEALKEVSFNLSLLPSGHPTPNPSEMLDSEEMKSLVKEINVRYDVALFDSPPLLAVADAMVLSNIVDGVLLVVCANRSERGALLEVKGMFGGTDTKLIGVVLNNVREGRKYGGYYYKYKEEED
jgi:capsular exopolysaccharide synthesis family protein